MGRWRAAPEGLNRTRLRRWPVLPVTAVCPPRSWGGGAHAGGAEPNPITPLACPPHLRRCVLPIHGEVAAKPPEGLNRARLRRWPCPPHLRRCVLPIHGEVARSAGGAEPSPITPLARGAEPSPNYTAGRRG